MGKIQLPSVGGIRKVIKTGDQSTPGTTIAELGNGTITLAQLAFLITQLQAQQANNGGGNIGAGDEATISLGPGLAGGGVLVGNVPIRLTAPIPAMLEDGVNEPDPPAENFNPTQSRIIQGDWVFSPSSNNPLVVNINTSTVIPIGGNNALQLIGADNSPARFFGDSFSAQAQFTFRRASGSYALPTPLTGGSTVGGLFWRGTINTQGGYSAGGAAILGIPRQTFTTASNGMAILFQTTPNSSTTMSTVWTIDQDGSFWSSNTPGSNQGPGTINANGYFVSGVALVGAAGPSGPAGPAVFLDANDGEDGWHAIPGSPGVNGVQGSQGPVGPQGPQGVPGSGTGLAIWVPEDIVTDEEVYRGPVSARGYLTINGPLNVTGTTTFVGTESLAGNLVFDATANRTVTFLGATPFIQASSSTAVLQITAGNGANPGSIQLGTVNAQNLLIQTGGSTVLKAGTSPQLSVAPGAVGIQGINCQAGSLVTHINMQWQNQGGSTKFGQVYGDGSWTIGTPNVVGEGPGTLNVSGGYYVNGQLIAGGANATPPGTAHGMIPEDPQHIDEPVSFAQTPIAVGPLNINGPLAIKSPLPVVVPGTTSIGTTTTGTVITTAGGIAIPALASTFWVVNVNGISYGVPLFAL